MWIVSGVLVEVSITSQFWVSKMQKSFFKENKRFECSVYRIQVQVIVNCLVDLKKHQTLGILLMTDFL